MPSIASDDALILSNRANPGGWNFRERQEKQEADCNHSAMMF
jgi:hypothetical protein